MKATKTYKIGEVCQGGVITIEITNKKIDVIGKEWDFSAGTRRSSDQSNAQEFCRHTHDANDPLVRRELEKCLTDLATSYHADQIIKWIESKVKLETSLHW